MSADTYKKYITKIYSERGQKEIFDGCQIMLSDNKNYWFTYNFEDQLNLLSALTTIILAQDTNIMLPYHSHNNPCKMYAAADIIKIYVGLQAHSIEVQTRVNMLNNWIRSLNNKEQLLEIQYNSTLPSPYMEQYAAVLQSSAGIIESILSRLLPADGGQAEIEGDPVEGDQDE